ncbi:MAG: extracellular solute-binding protein [Oscillospiraceae bacterium]|nr:extracellular solute-binding protein [Oscillospiraceae bacterium]
MKRILAFTLAAVMALSLAACGSKDKPAASQPAASPAASAPAAEKVTLNVIAAQYGTQTADWWAGFEKDFEAANDNIDLVVDVVSWNDIYTVVNTRIANGEAPDILNIDVFADYQADGLLLPAQDYVSEETYAKMYPSFLDQSVVDGTVWAVPDLASARALYYNADILAEAGVEVPTTFEELTAACQKIIDHFGGEVYPWGIDMTTDEGQAAFAYYTWNNGGGFVDDDGNWTLNSAENVAAIEYAIDLVKSGYTNTDPATQTRYDLQDLFGAGKLAMVIGPNSIPTYIADKGMSVNYGVASIPCSTGTSVSAGVMDRFMCFDNDYTDAELAAVTTFFDFFYDDARYSDWVLMEGFLPATSTGAELVAAADESMAAWIDIVGSCKFYPTAKAEWADVKQGVINVEQNALLGGNVQELLDTLQADIAG